MKRSCRLMPRLRARVPWLLLIHSWLTWAHPPQTHLHPGHCGGGGGGGVGGGGDGVQRPGLPLHLVAPLLLVATVASCWPPRHLT